MRHPDEYYQAQAAECRKLAAAACSKEAAAEFLHIANVWLTMASEVPSPAYTGLDFGLPLTSR